MLRGIGHLCARQSEEEEEKGADKLSTAGYKVVSCSVIKTISEGQALRMVLAPLCPEGRGGLLLLVHCWFKRPTRLNAGLINVEPEAE
jgi:hypothetical protein